MTLTVVEKHLTNSAYGFPSRGAQRRVKPIALACIHITGNKSTSANTNLHDAALDERNYANRAGSNGPSAHYYVARDGWAVEALEPATFAAWSNGDVNSPNTANTGIKAVLALKAKGYNANEAYVLEIENVGYPGDFPITGAQKQACAELIARESKRTGLPVSRATVHGHWEINSVDRWRCPSGGPSHETFLNDIIARAKAILTPPAPTDLTPYSQADLDAAVAKAADEATANTTATLTARFDALKAKVAADLDALIADIADD